MIRRLSADRDPGAAQASRPGANQAQASRAELDRRVGERGERRSRAVAAAAAVGGMASLTLVLLGSPATPTGQPSQGAGAAVTSSSEVTSLGIDDLAWEERTQ